MRTRLAFVGLGLWSALTAASAVSCGNDDDNNAKGGKGGTGSIITGGAAGTGGGTGGASGSGGAGGTGGSSTRTRIGAACTMDTDCGQGLMCITAGSGRFDGSGPARGYCSADCSGDAGSCADFGENVICLGFDTGSFCMQGCTFGPEGSESNPNKCRGSDEVACGPVFGPTDTPCTSDRACGTGAICDIGGSNMCLRVIPACLPQCNADADCGTGLFCNPRTGMCDSMARPGKALGSLCADTSDGGADECRGRCIGLVESSGGEPLTHLCAEQCTLGALPACGWAGPASGTPAPGLCLFSSTLIGDMGGPGGGDLGSCAKLCNCNADCSAVNPDTICVAIDNADIVQATKRRGYCTVGGTAADGGPERGIQSCAGTGGTGGAAGTGGAGGTGARDGG